MDTKTSLIQRIRLLIICSVGFVLIVAQPALVWADDDDPQPKYDDTETKVIESLNAPVAKALAEAGELNDVEDYDGILRVLDKLMEDYDDYNTTSKANIWQFYGYAYYQKDNIPKAIESYKKLVSIPDVAEKSEALYTGALYSIAQFYFLQEDYQNGVTALEKWFSVTPEPGAQAWILLGQGYYQLENYDKALPAILTAIEINDKEGKEVKETWYLLARAMYYMKEDYQSTWDILKILVERFPKEQYYAQMAAMYGELNKPYEQYSTMLAMYDDSMFESGTDYVVLAQFLMQNDNPFKAGQVLEDGLKKDLVEPKETTLKLLANAWVLSHENEKAIDALSQAAKVAETGDVYASLGQSYLNVEKWDQALDAINNAFKKGDMKRDDTAYIVKGMALFNLKRYDESIKAFEQARKDDRSRTTATQWLKYVKSERDREFELAKSLG